VQPAEKKGPVLEEEEPWRRVERIARHGCGGVAGVAGAACSGRPAGA
jgi:hypothetical protein